MICINANGSKWAGESPDPLEMLEERLTKYALRPDCCFIEKRGDVTRIWGNFHELSAVFSIDTDEPETIARLTALINANKATPAFQRAMEDEKRRLEYWERREKEKEEARREARKAQYQKLAAEFGE